MEPLRPRNSSLAGFGVIRKSFQFSSEGSSVYVDVKSQSYLPSAETLKEELLGNG